MKNRRKKTTQGNRKTTLADFGLTGRKNAFAELPDCVAEGCDERDCPIRRDAEGKIGLMDGYDVRDLAIDLIDEAAPFPGERYAVILKFLDGHATVMIVRSAASVAQAYEIPKDALDENGLKALRGFLGKHDVDGYGVLVQTGEREVAIVNETGTPEEWKDFSERVGDLFGNAAIGEREAERPWSARYWLGGPFYLDAEAAPTDGDGWKDRPTDAARVAVYVTRADTCEKALVAVLNTDGTEEEALKSKAYVLGEVGNLAPALYRLLGPNETVDVIDRALELGRLDEFGNEVYFEDDDDGFGDVAYFGDGDGDDEE